MQIAFTTKMVSPEEAQSLLASNKGNRTLSDKNVNFLYKQMAKGKWLNTSDTIKISKTGKLLDGQHRLAAVVKLGEPVKLTIAENLDDNIFEVLDTGKTRNAADVLSIKGFKNVNNIAGTCRFILLFLRGNYTHHGTNRESKVTNGEILEFAEQTPELNDILHFTDEIYRRHMKGLSSTILAGLYFILSKKSQKDADFFFQKYGNGIELKETSPIRHLRERFIRDQINKSQLKARDKIALFIFAWNAFRQKRKMSQLTLQRNYIFPKPL